MALEKDAESSNDEDEEEEDPLSKGIDSVSWLPSVKEKQPKEENESKVSYSNNLYSNIGIRKNCSQNSLEN